MDNINDSALDRQLEDLDEPTGSKAATGRENVAVMVRCKPMAATGGQQNRIQAVEVDQTSGCVWVAERQFTFDTVFGPESSNEQVYMKSTRRLVDAAFSGYNCTIFLYGQTGTGKTYTHSSLTQSAFEHLFSLIRDSNNRASFLLRASYYELYNEDIRDLLTSSNKPLELRESKARGVYVKDLTSYLVNNLKDLEKLKKLGDKRRATAATKMNEYSSRSHSMFSITIETLANSDNSNIDDTNASAKSRTKTNAVRVGHLHLIDLAGSERQSKSGSTGTRLKEASRINLSLTCLSLVIRALTDSNSNHVPYRNSKLTRLLSSSLGGNSKTLLIACISLARVHLDETLNTLRFASRTKRIENSAKINEDPKDALLRNYRRQISDLKRKLQESQHHQVTNEEEAIDSMIAQESQSNDQSETLLKQLKLLQAKIMVGGENLLEKAEMHERLIEASRNELEEKRRIETELKERLEKKRAIIEQVTQSKGSLEGQLLTMDDKLKRALLLYKKSKEELKDLTGEHQELKENLLQSIKATSKEIKYADCIIEDFIPSEYLDLINTYAQYDEESDEWQIKYIALSGNNIAQTRRLTEGRTTSSLELGEENSDSDAKEERKICLNERSDPYIRL